MKQKKEISELRVMIVDDVASYRDELSKILRSLGVVYIQEMENGRKAWDKIILESRGQEKHDLIISDINMPQMSGIELLQNIRAYNRTTRLPLILVSTESDRDTVLQAIIIGISDYLLKPYEEQSASKKIKNVLLTIIE